MTARISCFFLFLLATTSASGVVCDNSALYIHGGHIWTPDGGFERADLLLDDGSISRIVTDETASPPAGVRTLDVTGKVVLPGLVDLHSHFFELGGSLSAPLKRSDLDRNFFVIGRSLIRSGVTSARAHLFDLEHGPRFSEFSQSDCIASPRIQYGGPGFIGGAPELRGFQVWGVASTEDARDKVRRAHGAGASWIALHALQEFRPGELEALVDEARLLGMGVMAGGDHPASIRRAIDVDVDTIEYMDLTTAAELPQDLVEALSNDPSPPVFVPTLSYYFRAESSARSPGTIDYGVLNEFLPESDFNEFRAAVTDLFTNEPDMEIQQAFPTLQRKFSQLVEAGVPFGTGTDNGSPGNFHYGSIWLEMRIWSEWGVPPETIIEAATSRGAEALGLDDIGRIAEGARADLVIYSGDILNGDFSADRVDAVTKGGVLYR